MYAGLRPQWLMLRHRDVNVGYLPFQTSGGDGDSRHMGLSFRWQKMPIRVETTLIADGHNLRAKKYWMEPTLICKHFKYHHVENQVKKVLCYYEICHYKFDYILYFRKRPKRWSFFKTLQNWSTRKPSFSFQCSRLTTNYYLPYLPCIDGIWY